MSEAYIWAVMAWSIFWIVLICYVARDQIIENLKRPDDPYEKIIKLLSSVSENIDWIESNLEKRNRRKRSKVVKKRKGTK